MEEKKRYRIGMLAAGILLASAIVADLVDLIPLVGTVLAPYTGL